MRWNLTTYPNLHFVQVYYRLQLIIKKRLRLRFLETDTVNSRFETPLVVCVLMQRDANCPVYHNLLYGEYIPLDRTIFNVLKFRPD